jgi:ATP-dependent exoDNAse (exonuclease V) alpha subunit
MLPDGAPERLGDRSTLWNEVEATELRKDAQLSREVEFAIPRELTQQQGIDLARDFVREEFVDRGMIADLNVHWDMGADGMAKPHAQPLLGAGILCQPARLLHGRPGQCARTGKGHEQGRAAGRTAAAP